MIDNTVHSTLANVLNDLRTALAELDVQIENDNDAPFRSLIRAWRHFNPMARIIAPEMVVAIGPDDEAV